jgi:hypothetical protein
MLRRFAKDAVEHNPGGAKREDAGEHGDDAKWSGAFCNLRE